MFSIKSNMREFSRDLAKVADGMQKTVARTLSEIARRTTVRGLFRRIAMALVKGAS